MKIYLTDFKGSCLTCYHLKRESLNNKSHRCKYYETFSLGKKCNLYEDSHFPKWRIGLLRGSKCLAPEVKKYLDKLTKQVENDRNN
jgi:hypothetical protein